MGIVVAAAAIAAGPSIAHAAVLQNDSFVTGGLSVCQPFNADEAAGAGFAAPAEDYPIRIDSVQVLGCSTDAAVDIGVFADDLDADAEPEPPLFYETLEPVDFTSGLQTFDVVDDLFVTSGGVRVVVVASSTGVQLATDADSTISAPNNTVALSGGWEFSSELGYQNDFVIRANYTSLSAVKFTKKPKKTVKTKSKKALVKFGFEVEGGDDFDFECRFDDATYKKCVSGQLFKVGAGRHVFYVRASSGDVGGNFKTYGFKVKRK